MDDVVQIRIGKHMVGIIGLKTALAKAAEQFNHAPVDHIGKGLREQLSQHNYIPAGNTELYEKAFEREYRKFIGSPVAETDYEGIQIKVLGPGCPQCERLDQEVMTAMSETGIMAELEHVRDLAEIGRYGVMGAPALVINGAVKVVGSVPPREKIRTWIRQAAERTS